VRRIPAYALLLVAVSLSLISPLIWAQAKKELPACCRRDGKHHCAQNKTQPSAAGVQISAQSACPLFPPAISSPAPALHGDAPPDQTIAAGFVPVYAAPRGPVAFKPAPVSNRPWQQRGPPSLVS